MESSHSRSNRPGERTKRSISRRIRVDRQRKKEGERDELSGVVWSFAPTVVMVAAGVLVGSNELREVFYSLLAMALLGIVVYCCHLITR